jgi:phage-related tail fiber protein
LQIATAASTYLALSGGTLSGNLTLPGVPTTTNMAATKGYVDTQIAAIPAATDLTPAGTVIWTARTTAPTGYLKANGAAISRTTYATLFSAIGTTYGVGDGSTTFNLPDLRGEFIRGWDDARGVDPGRNLGSAQAQDYLSHSHPITDPGHSHTVISDVTQGSDASSFYTPNGVSAFRPMPTSLVSTGITATNNNGGTETRPRNIALLGCIKT